MKVLSIDWDYFFTNPEPFEFGANEQNAIFYEAIWPARCSAFNPYTKKEVLEEYNPIIPNNFWSSVLINRPPMLVAESHFTLWSILKQFEENDLSPTTIISLDAHHDCGYFTGFFDNKKTKTDCSNWGEYGIRMKLIDELHLHYPEWRKKSQEPDPIIKPSSVSYELPKNQFYDYIFICRSGCWTPPWCDPEFYEFVESSNLSYKFLDELVGKERSPNKIEAQKIRDEHKNLIEESRLRMNESTY